MFYPKDEQEQEALKFIMLAADVAKSSLCLRSKCGSVIVKNGEVIGEGFNAPPGNKKLKRCFKDDIPKNFKSDRNCCIHAEERAIMHALKTNGDKIVGSRLYFIRLDNNDTISRAGKPFCTICSKMALDAGVSEFVLYHDDGVCVYDTEEYNNLSFEYRE
ncbi:hypothetical protein GOV04_01290 [Candidatus Woesearchaeota archaeon]|nr:hypothetical protein [Candidatus Woesearchaeota archaeon]